MLTPYPELGTALFCKLVQTDFEDEGSFLIVVLELPAGPSPATCTDHPGLSFLQFLMIYAFLITQTSQNPEVRRMNTTSGCSGFAFFWDSLFHI